MPRNISIVKIGQRSVPDYHLSERCQKMQSMNDYGNQRHSLTVTAFDRST